MKRYFVISDVHNYYQPMKQALAEAGFERDNPNHIVILNGDLFDRGPNPVESFCYISDLVSEGRCFYVMGNHEDNLIEACIYENFVNADYSNGTAATIFALASHLNDNGLNYGNMYQTVMRHIVSFIANNAYNYIEFDKYIITHSWIPTIQRSPDSNDVRWNPDWRNATSKDWRVARWSNPYERAKRGMNQTGKKIVSGHWHVSYAWNKEEGVSEFKPGKWDIFENDSVIMIDRCTAYTGRCNVFVFDAEEEPKCGRFNGGTYSNEIKFACGGK